MEWWKTMLITLNYEARRSESTQCLVCVNFAKDLTSIRWHIRYVIRYILTSVDRIRCQQYVEQA